MEPQTTEAPSTARDFFLYVAAMVALYISVASLIWIILPIIDVLLPDTLRFEPTFNLISFQMALLIVLFPVYVKLTKFLNRDLVEHPEKEHRWYRRWLLYLTLFVTGAMLVGDAVAIIFQFLNGDITLRFFLKALAILVIGGLVFKYYLLDLKGGFRVHAEKMKQIKWVSVTLIVLTLITAFVVFGSPWKQRGINLDSQRVSDLQSIQWKVLEYYRETGELPTTLEDIQDDFDYYPLDLEDPKTGDPYVYTIDANKPLSFSLCAEFTYSIIAKSDRWAHDSGMFCFDRAIDPQRYSVYDR